jgi:hypothetical protein
MTTPISTADLIDGRALLPLTLFNRMVARIGADHPELPDGMPARIMDQALAFLGTCATATEPIGPSDAVDIGWHTFILYTREYAEFCSTVAGRFIHHVPDDEPGTEWPVVPQQSHPKITLATTVAAMKMAGYRIDAELWPTQATADCTKCHQCHAGCHDSPTR